jgi:acyl-CoA thioester hydrolase
MTHRHPIRVYYEDTDLGGIVYYANYLRFIERGRSEWVASLGLDQRQMQAEQGLVFAVRRVEADYLKPAHLWDDLTVTTAVTQITPARIELDQAVLRGAQTLFTAKVTLVCLGPGHRPTRLPDTIRRHLTK